MSASDTRSSMVDTTSIDALPVGEYVVNPHGVSYIVTAVAATSLAPDASRHRATYEAQTPDSATRVWLHESFSPEDLSGMMKLSEASATHTLRHVAELLPPFSMPWFDSVVRYYAPEIIPAHRLSEAELSAQSKKNWEIWVEHLALGLHELHNHGLAFELDESMVLSHIGVLADGAHSVAQWQRLGSLVLMQDKPDAEYADVRALARVMARTKLLEAPSHVRYALQTAARPDARVSAATLLRNLNLGSPSGIEAGGDVQATKDRRLRAELGHATSRGMLRDDNEDSLCAMEISLRPLSHDSAADKPVLLAVADGMGGIEAGEVASALAIHNLTVAASELFATYGVALNGAAPDPELNEWVQRTVTHINAAVVAEGVKRSNQMGTTLAFALVVDGMAYLGNVGDSRIYRWHAQHDDGKLVRLVKDHSLVQSLVDVGVLSDEERYTHPERSLILRSLGDPNTGLSDENAPVPIQRGDWLLLCSDGLWEMVRDDAIRDVLAHASNAQVACDRLVDLANANGGEDNISVVIGRFL